MENNEVAPIKTLSERLKRKEHLYSGACHAYDQNLSRLLENILRDKIDKYEADSSLSTVASFGLAKLLDKPGCENILKKQDSNDSKAQMYLCLLSLVEKLSINDKHVLLERLGNSSLDELFEFVQQRVTPQRRLVSVTKLY